MTKSNIVEKIDNIITKINENENKNLSDKEARKLLRGIDEDLVEIEKNVEGKQKGIVEKKVKEFREEIDKNLSKSLGWGGIKTFLIDDVKDDLVELKNEIVKLEEVQTIPTSVVNEREAELEKELVEVKEELGEWRKLFPKQNPKEASKKIEELGKGWAEQQKKMIELQQELGKSEPNIVEVGKAVSDVAYRFERLGGDIGKEALPLFGTAIGGILGGGGGIIAGGVQYGAHFVNKGMDMVGDAGKDAKNFAEKIVGVGADGVEKWRKGAQDVVEKGMGDVKEVVVKNLNVVEKAVEGGVGVKAGIFEAGIGVGRNVAKEVESEMLRNELEEKKQELERNRIKHEQELKDERERFAQELKEKTAEIERLQKQMEKQSDKTQDNFLSVIEMVTKSSSRSSSPTPPAYVKDPQ